MVALYYQHSRKLQPYQRKMQSAKDVITRLREALNCSNDAALAKAMKVAPSTVATWRRRNSVPYPELIELALKDNINLHWLLTGEGERNKKGFVFSGIDPEILSISISLAERWPHRKKSVSTPQLASLIGAFYGDLAGKYHELKNSSGLERDQIIHAMRLTYGLPENSALFDWYSVPLNTKERN
jgi:transcriptional regulator with XRE-family HTH domain